MVDDTPRTRWQRFWQFVQEFMPGEDEEETDGEVHEEEAETETPAPVNHRALEVEAARQRQMDGLTLTAHEQFILGAPEVYTQQHIPTLALNQTDIDVRTALYGCLAREMGRDVTPYFISRYRPDYADLHVPPGGTAVSARLDRGGWPYSAHRGALRRAAQYQLHARARQSGGTPEPAATRNLSTGESPYV